MRKRLLGILLCLTVLTSLLVMNVPVAANDYSDIEMATEILSNLGIITSNTDVEGVLDQKVSRATFADMVAKIMDISQNEKIYFTDISAEHWAAGSINALVEAGIISVSNNRKFNPDEYVTFEQACKIMLCAAGYGEYSSINGGFPNGYIRVAKRLGISDGITSVNELSLADSIRIIWSGVTTPTYMGKRFGTDGSVAYTVDDETILSIYRNLYMGRGRVTAIKGATLEDTNAEDNEIYIDGIKFNKAETLNAKTSFAKIVDFIYEKNGEETFVVKAIDVLEDRNNILTIRSDELAGFSSTTYQLSYTKANGKAANTTILRGATVVYNGKPYTGKLTDVITELKGDKHRGTITLIDSGKGNSIVVIESFRPFVVSIKDSKNVIYNRYDSSDKVDIGKEKTVSFYDANGELYINEISVDSILMIAISKDTEFVNAVVLSFGVTGNVDATFNGGKKVIIDGQEYKIDETFKANSTDFDAGTSWQIAVDQFGYIIAGKLDHSTSALKPGVLVDAAYKSESFNYEVLFKIFDETGKMGVYNLADKVVIDGKSYTKEKYIDAVLENSSLLPKSAVSGTALSMSTKSLIRFRLDADGNVKVVDTTYPGTNEDPQYTLTEIKTQYDYYNVSSGYNRFVNNATNGKLIDGHIPYSDAETKTFSVPRVDEYGRLIVRKLENNNAAGSVGSYTGSIDTVLKDEMGNPMMEEDSMYKTGIVFGSTYTYQMDIYKWNADSPYADAVVVHSDAATRDIKYYMVKGFSQALDENGDIVNVLDTHSGSFNVKTSIAGIKTGDIVRIDKNDYSNMVNEISKVYDVEKQRFTVFDSTSGTFVTNETQPAWWVSDISDPYSYYARFQATTGKIIDIKNGYIYIKWNTFANADKNLNGYDEVVSDKIAITVYDKNATNSDFEVYNGSISDLTAEKLAGIGSTVVHAFYGNSSDSGLFVFK